MGELIRNVGKKLPDSARRRMNTARQLFGSPYARTRLGLGIRPLSYQWSYDRGLEIARFYLESKFLPEFAADISGRVLEFFSDDYIHRFGDPTQLTQIDVLNLEDGIPGTTVQADLTKPNDIPDNTFDCIVCTHVLQLIDDFDAAVDDMYRILKPGGVLLVAVPHVSMCDSEAYTDFWRFTRLGLQMVMERNFDPADIEMRAYGNSLTAAGEIRGLCAHEFTRRELDHHDERFAVEICARAVKRS
ncbi:MAG: methyltransferase domain-containing protein [Mycobacterium sp.]